MTAFRDIFSDDESSLSPVVRHIVAPNLNIDPRSIFLSMNADYIWIGRVDIEDWLNRSALLGITKVIYR
jgi:hypothetical protein